MRFTLFLLLTLLSALLTAQEGQHKTVFDIFHKGKDIGDLTASKRVSGNSVTYRIQTDINQRILTIKKCHYDLQVEYINGALHESDYELYLNDKLDKWVKVQDTGGKMIGSKNGKNSVDLGGEIRFSSALFFFKEPLGVETTFSESNMKTRSLSPDKTAPGVYILDKGKGSYHYENGILMKVVMKDLINLEMVRRQ